MRYRQDDPFTEVLLNKAWASGTEPALEPQEKHEFEVHMPGYDVRRLMMAEDPLAAANAFFVQIRTVLATILGIRMCPFCPHCSNTKYPCQDALGSVAEAMGGIAGRVDAMFGAVESQKVTGALHYHFFIFVQRLHQYATLKEIAEKLKTGLVQAFELKNFTSAICCESYSDLEQFNQQRQELEDNHPTYSERTECGNEKKPTWGKYKLGRLPEFVYEDAKEKVHGLPDNSNVDHIVDANEYKKKFAEVFQYFQSHCQHHVHKLVQNPKTGEKKRMIPNACVCKNKPKECKHEAPWTNRVSPKWMTQPLLVCKGLAK